jgi:hypothetical protein
MKKLFFLLPLFLIAPFWLFAEQQPDSIASADHPRHSVNTGSHGAGALPEIYGLRNDWMNEFSGKKSDTLKKGNAFYEIDLIQWMPPGCPSCRKALPKACL